jgi:hypothetical protein
MTAPAQNQCLRLPSLGRTSAHDDPTNVISATPIESADVEHPLREDFRCADDFGFFSVAELPSAQCGFFGLGTDAVCYGRCSGPVAADPAGARFNALDHVRLNGRAVELPFDPGEVIGNLRMERYATNSTGTEKNLLYHFYYALRPYLPVRFRRHLQRMRLRQSRKSAFPHWPVDFSVEDIQEQLLYLALRAEGRPDVPFVWFWPRSFRACAILTHDVETEAGLSFCPELMDLNDSFGIKSSFQLIPEKRYTVSDAVLSGIRERGFEVNVHDLNHDGHLYSDRYEFLRRAEKINQYSRSFGAKGFRAGAMYRNLDWYEAFEFSYDMSVPNVGHLEAQTGGCCTVRPYFIGNIVELPLTTTQDYSLFHILGDYSINLWKQQIHAILERHGLISFIVHPDYIIERKARETYTSLLRYLSELRDEGKLWIARPGEVADWWRQRNCMQLVERAEDPWYITGPGQQDAHIAYAIASESGVEYRLSGAPCTQDGIR